MGYLGVGTRDPADGSRGATVVELVPGGPAERGGVEIGDVITAVDGNEVLGSGELGAVLREMAPGTSVQVTVDREGRTRQLTVTLGERPPS